MKNQRNNDSIDKSQDMINMKKRKSLKTVIDKAIFIILAVVATIVFIWDVIKDFIPETMWQLKLLIMIVGALSGFFSLLSFLWDKKFTNTSEKVKEDIGEQLVNEKKNIVATVENSMFEIKDIVGYVGDLAAILSSNEDRRISFARRRLAELNKSLEFVAHEHESERLSVSTYYGELNYLKEQLQLDTKKRDCVIWAMTGFSDEEWDDDGNDLEKYWCDDLVKLTKSIITKRVCIVHSKLITLLNKDEEFYCKQKKDWEENKFTGEKIAEKSLKSFIDYLKTYYSSNKSEYKITSVCVKSDTQTFKILLEAKGFFGIQLSNNQKYLIKGEAVDVHTGLQGQFVFDDKTINELFSLHNIAITTCDELTSFILKTSSKAFINFCANEGIVLGENR